MRSHKPLRNQPYRQFIHCRRCPLRNELVEALEVEAEVHCDARFHCLLTSDAVEITLILAIALGNNIPARDPHDRMVTAEVSIAPRELVPPGWRPLVQGGISCTDRDDRQNRPFFSPPAAQARIVRGMSWRVNHAQPFVTS